MTLWQWIKRLIPWALLLGACFGLYVWWALAAVHKRQAIEAMHFKDSVRATYPQLHHRPGEDPNLVKRGAYLVRAGNCISCHTAPEGRAFAGGRPLRTPFGTIYIPNITSDPVHGLGHWTFKDFLRCMKEGIRPDGSYNYPAFPYPYFNHLSDQDIRAIWAYVQDIPAVAQPNRTNDMPFPFNLRFLQLGWRIMFFYGHRGELQPNPQHDAAWNRGNLLVNGLGHCQMCHTPINFLGGPKRDQAFAGGKLEDFYAPSIAGNTALKGVTLDQIVHFFHSSQRANGTQIAAASMLQVNNNSLSYLDDSDLRAIGTYLKSLHVTLPKIAKGSDKAKKIYETYCAACHTNGAAGAPKLGDATAWSERLKTQGKAMVVHQAIMGINAMPAKGNCVTCTDQDIEDTIDYILDLSLGQAKGGSAQPKGPAPAQPTLARGKQVYDKVCSTCHARGNLGAPKLGDTSAWSKRLQQGVDVMTWHVITGQGKAPRMGACPTCSGTDILAAVKYMLQHSGIAGNFKLW